ncbi:unnamed protein product [Closterium sp. NIES-54]
MASLCVLVFDHEGRPVQFDTWLDDLQLYLLSDSKDIVSLFDLVSRDATAPPATADTQALYSVVVARYSSPATTALGRLLLPYLFPELSAFATVEDLVSHLHASDARYRAAIHAEFLDKNPPPTFITLYFIVTRLPDSLRSVRDHFLSLDPTSLTVDLLAQHLLAAETSAVAVGAARGTSRPPFFEGCSPSPLAPSYASAAAADVSVAEYIGAASASAKRRSSKGKGGRGGSGGSGGGGGGSGSGGGGSKGGGGGCGSGGGSGGSGGGSGGSCGSGGSGGSGTGGGGTGARRLREWYLRGASGGSCPYVIRTGDRAGQTCGRLHTQHRCFSRLDDAWSAEFGDDVELPRWADLLRSRIAIFDLDFDVFLSAMYALPISAEGDCYRCVPPDPGIAAAALGASKFGTLPGTAPAEALHTFTLDSGASRCFFRDSTTLTPLPPPVPVRLADTSGGPVVARSSTVLPCLAVAASAQVSASGQVAASCSCRLLSHQTLQWHHCLGHPSWPRLRGMHSRLLVIGLPRSVPPLPPSPAPPCLPCVKGRQRAAPHSSSFNPTTAPLQTLHMDVWGPVRASGQSRERYFLLVVDDYSQYNTVFPLRNKGQVVDVWIPWIRTVHLQLRERFGQDLPVLRLQSDRGGEFSSNLLRDFCGGEGILQSFTLPDSPQQNGIAERRIDLVMELNLWPRVSLSETSPTLRWTGEVGDASVFRFYHPTSRRVIPSQDVTFDESVPFYRLFPYRSAPPPPPPLFLAPGPSPVDPLLAQGPASSGVSQVDPFPGPVPVQVAVDSGAARGGASWGAASGGAEPGGAGSEGAETEGAETGDAEPGGAGFGGAEPEGVEPGGAASEGAESGGAEPQGAASSGATRAGGAGAAGAGVTGGSAATNPGGACTGGTRAAGPGGVAGARAGDTTEPGAVGAGGARAGGAGVGGPGAGGAGAAGAGVGGVGVGGTGTASAGAFDPRAGGSVRPRPYFVPLLQQVLASRQRDYELHSLDFSTAFLQGSVHEEIWLRRPPCFSKSFPAGTQWSLRRPVYGLRQAPRDWHDTLRTTLAALGFALATADLSLFLRTDTTLPPFYVLVYVDDLVFATADTEALTLILQRFGFHFSSPQPTPLSTSHSLSAPPSYESIEPSGPYPELVGFLMYLMTCTRPDLAYPLSLLARYVAPGRHRKVHWDAAKRVLRYLCSTSGMGLVLGGRGLVVLTGHADTFWELRWLTYLLTDLGERPRSPPVLYVDNKAIIALCQEHRLEHQTKHIALRYFLARELQQRGQLRLAYVGTRANTADVFTKALPLGDHQHFVTVLGLVPTLPHLLTA